MDVTPASPGCLTGLLSFKRLAPAAPARLRPGRAPPSTCTMPRLRQLARPFVVPDCGLIQFRVPWSAYPASDGLTVGPDLLPESPGTLL